MSICQWKRRNLDLCQRSLPVIFFNQPNGLANISFNPVGFFVAVFASFVGSAVGFRGVGGCCLTDGFVDFFRLLL